MESCNSPLFGLPLSPLPFPRRGRTRTISPAFPPRWSSGFETQRDTRVLRIRTRRFSSVPGAPGWPPGPSCACECSSGLDSVVHQERDALLTEPSLKHRQAALVSPSPACVVMLRNACERRAHGGGGGGGLSLSFVVLKVGRTAGVDRLLLPRRQHRRHPQYHSMWAHRPSPCTPLPPSSPRSVSSVSI